MGEPGAEKYVEEVVGVLVKLLPWNTYIHVLDRGKNGCEIRLPFPGYSIKLVTKRC